VIIIGSLEEIFFDDSEMSTEEMMWNVLLWYGEVFNPLNIIRPGKFTTKRGLVQSATGAGITGSAMYAASLLNTVPGQGVTAQRALMTKANAYRSLAQGTVRAGAHVGRGLLSPIFGALATAVTGAWAYEMYVNNPLRDAHPGDIDWFGPFASGLGTVV